MVCEQRFFSHVLMPAIVIFFRSHFVDACFISWVNEHFSLKGAVDI